MLNLEKLVFNKPYKKDDIVNDRLAKFFLLYIDEELVSYIYYSGVEDFIELYRIATHVNHQKKGHAKRLFLSSLHSLTSFNRIILEVNCFNSAAIALYESLGFRKYYIRRNYYENGDDAILMEKILKSGSEE